MSLLLYGITSGGSGAIIGVGLQQRELRGVAEGPLVAIVSDHDGSGPNTTIDDLREYAQTVQGLMDRRAILPARFASVLADDDAARAMLANRRQELVTSLERVDGAVELGVRAGWRTGAASVDDRSPESGTAYLHARLESRRRAREVARILDPLGSVARSRRQALAARPELAMTAAYLVDRDRTDEFVSLLAALDERLEDVELVCTGPWPAYTFAQQAPA